MALHQRTHRGPWLIGCVAVGLGIALLAWPWGSGTVSPVASPPLVADESDPTQQPKAMQAAAWPRAAAEGAVQAGTVDEIPSQTDTGSEKETVDEDPSRPRVAIAALVAAGLDPEVAEEIAASIDRTWVNLRGNGGIRDAKFRQSKTRIVSDILFSFLPALSELIKDHKIEVTVTPRTRNGGHTLGFQISADGRMFLVQVQGRKFDVEFPLRCELQPGPLWTELVDSCRSPRQGR